MSVSQIQNQPFCVFFFFWITRWRWINFFIYVIFTVFCVRCQNSIRKTFCWCWNSDSETSHTTHNELSVVIPIVITYYSKSKLELWLWDYKRQKGHRIKDKGCVASCKPPEIQSYLMLISQQHTTRTCTIRCRLGGTQTQASSRASKTSEG